MQTETTPPRIHVLAKPAEAICTLDCEDCFVLDLAEEDGRRLAASRRKAGRNESYPCGSGQEFKEFHGVRQSGKLSLYPLTNCYSRKYDKGVYEPWLQTNPTF